MEQRNNFICLWSLYLIAGALSSNVMTTQLSSTVSYVPTQLWHNETCEDLCACIENIMDKMIAPQICMEVKGYPCHLLKQLRRQRVTPNRRCVATMEGTWFECNEGNMGCTRGIVDKANYSECLSADPGSDSGASNIVYLGCESNMADNTSVTCVMSRDGDAVGQCVNKAKCLYKKERVSCPNNWIALKRHCLSPISMDQQNWSTARNTCMDRWQSPLLSITSFRKRENRTMEVDELEKAEVLKPGQEVWLGLFRDDVNSSFRWLDDTVITDDQSYWPWADGHPSFIPGHNYVYIHVSSGLLFTAEEAELHRYSCKLRVSKSLSCREPHPTPVPMTTEIGNQETSTMEETTKNIEESKTISEELNDVLKQFSNDTAMVEIFEHFILIAEPLNDNDNMNTEDRSIDFIRSLDSIVDGLAESINSPSKPIVVSTPEIVLKVLTLCIECEDEALGGQIGNQSFSLSLPDSIKAAGATLALSTASLLHKELPATIEENEGDNVNSKNQIGSLVTTISLRRWDGEPLKLTDDAPMELTFSNLEVVEKAMTSCRYWKVDEANGDGVWSSQGCDVSPSSNSKHTVCHITHLTSFAVIMRITTDEDDPLPIALEYLTWVGCALSITCLAIMLIIFLTQRMYRADRNIIHMNLAMSLMLAQIIFLSGIDTTNNEGICKAVGICVHFFLLATFFWMLNEGIFLLSKTTSARTRWLRLPTYFTIGWVFPIIIVAVTMGVSFASYDTTKRCWLTTDNGGIFAFIGPAAAVILINICILVNVIRVFLSLKANMNKKKAERIKIALRALLLTLPLLGCTWLIGILSFNSKTHVFAYIFVVMNSLQGVFIFILYCVLNDEIKKSVRKRLAILQSLSGRTSHTRASRTATGGSNNVYRPSKTGHEQGQEAAKL